MLAYNASVSPQWFLGSERWSSKGLAKNAVMTSYRIAWRRGVRAPSALAVPSGLGTKGQSLDYQDTIAVLLAP
jgi:hypothetical protein